MSSVTRYIAVAPPGAAPGAGFKARSRKWRATYDLAEALERYVAHERDWTAKEAAAWAKYACLVGAGRTGFVDAPDGTKWFVRTRWELR
jgi:hypothetical protein